DADAGGVAGAGLFHRRVLVERGGRAGAVHRQRHRDVADALPLDRPVLLLISWTAEGAPSPRGRSEPAGPFRARGAVPSARGRPHHPLAKNTCGIERDRKSTRLNSSHVKISYAVF